MQKAIFALKFKDAVQRATANGVPPWPNMTPRYDRAADGKFTPNARAPILCAAIEHGVEARVWIGVERKYSTRARLERTPQFHRRRQDDRCDASPPAGRLGVRL
jgi:hypothetical protein